MKVSRHIIFSLVPAKGFLRIENLLQITQIPKIEPKAPYQFSHHPILLEFNIEELNSPFSVEFPEKYPDFVKGSYTYGNNLYVVLTLLNIFTRYHFFVYKSEQFWAIEIGNEDKNQIPTFRSWVQNDYLPKTKLEYPNDEFVNFTDKPVKEIPAKDYFTANAPIFSDREIASPDSFGQMFRNYLALSEEVKTKFLNSCILYNKSFEIFKTSPSLFLIGIMSAIENLIPPLEAKPCKTCGQPIYSVVRRFKEYFNKYTGGGNFSWANKLYKARSSISHRGGLLLIDTMPLNPYFDEKIERDQLLIAVRIILINWFIAQSVI